MPDHVWRLPLPLTSERLRLREHREGDLDDLLVFHGDQEVTRYTPWPTRDRTQTRDALSKRIGQRQAAATGEAIVLAAEEVSSGTVIGEALLLCEADDKAMLGYAIRRDRWGRGLATEAASTLVDSGFQVLGLQGMSAAVIPANVASIVVLRRLGFTPVFKTIDRATFELTVERWRAHRVAGSASTGPALANRG